MTNEGIKAVLGWGWGELARAETHSPMSHAGPGVWASVATECSPCPALICPSPGKSDWKESKHKDSSLYLVFSRMLVISSIKYVLWSWLGQAMRKRTLWVDKRPTGYRPTWEMLLLNRERGPCFWMNVITHVHTVTFFFSILKNPWNGEIGYLTVRIYNGYWKLEDTKCSWTHCSASVNLIATLCSQWHPP